MSVNLTSTQIKDTYQRLLQVSGNDNIIHNGTGSVETRITVANVLIDSGNLYTSGTITANNFYGTASIAATASLLLGSIESSSFTHTASYAVNAQTSSYALTASLLLGSIESASFAYTASYASNALTASFVTASNVIGIVESASYALTASHVLGSSETASYALTASYVENAFTSSFITGSDVVGIVNSASFALTASHLLGNAETASYASTASYVESALTASYVENAQTASFITGSDIVGIVNSASFALTASYLLGSIETASLAYTASYVESASYATTASYVLNAVSASYALSSSHEITYELFSSRSEFADTASLSLTASVANKLTDPNNAGDVYKIGNVWVVDDSLRVKGISARFESPAYFESDVEVSASNLILTGSNNKIETDGVISASFFHGNGSDITNVTASFITASNVIGIVDSSSFALTASLLLGSIESSSYALTASYVENALTASFITASNVIGIIDSASYALTASHVLGSSETASYALTASYVENALTASFITASNVIGIVESASYALTASHVLGSSATASYALTASYVENAFTASFITGSDVVGIVESASFALTASYVLGSSATSSYALTASYVENALTASFITGSNVVGIVESASYAENSTLFNGLDTSSFILTGSTGTSQILSGSLTVTQNLTVLGNATYTTITASEVILNQNTLSVFASGNALPEAGFKAVDTSSNFASGSLIYNVENGEWTVTGGLKVAPAYILTVTSASITSASIDNLVASGIINSASYALTASHVLGSSETASYALTASYVENAFTASFVTASNVVGIVESASYALTASHVLGSSETASYALTASYVENAFTASFITASNVIGIVESASYALTASSLLGSIESASYASTASYVLNATTASYIASESGYIITGKTGSSQTINTDLLLKGRLSAYFGDIITGNVALGLGAMNQAAQSDASIANNTIIGRDAAASISSGNNNNTVIGNSAMNKYTTGYNNIAIGASALPNHSSSYDTVAIGYSIGNTFNGITDKSIYIGKAQPSGGIEEIVIGEANGLGDYTTIIGNRTTTLTKLMGHVTASAFTGSFYGSGSGIVGVQSASYATSASHATSALTASLLLGSVESASFASTASYLSPSATASYALTASLLLGSVETASLAYTASYIDPATLTGSFIYTGEVTGSEQLINTKLKLKNILNLQAGTSNDNVLIGNQVASGFDLTDSNALTFPRQNITIGSIIFSANRSDGSTNNIAIGQNIFRGTDTSSYVRDNIAIGNRALENHIGSECIAIGHEALRYNSQSGTPSNTIAIGYQAGQYLNDGGENIYIGKQAANQYTNGNNNTRNYKSVVIGDVAQLGGDYADSFHEIVIGYGAKGKGTRTTVIGSSETNYTYLWGAVTASSFTGSFYGTSSWASDAISASYAENSTLFNGLDTSSFILTGSTGTSQILSGSLTITQNLNVLGNATYTTITASEVILNQNTLSVFASGNALPEAGFKAIDTSSAFASGSLIYNVENGEWTVTGGLKVAPAYTFTATTASITSASIDNLVVNGVDVTEQMSLTKRFNVTSSVSWSLAHNFNTTTPMVQVYSASKVIIPLEIESLDANNTKITFSTATEGTAVIIK